MNSANQHLQSTHWCVLLLVRFILLDSEMVALVHRQQAATELQKERSMIPIKKNDNSATNGVYTLPEREFQIALLGKLGKI